MTIDQNSYKSRFNICSTWFLLSTVMDTAVQINPIDYEQITQLLMFMWDMEFFVLVDLSLMTYLPWNQQYQQNMIINACLIPISKLHEAHPKTINSDFAIIRLTMTIFSEIYSLWNVAGYSGHALLPAIFYDTIYLWENSVDFGKLRPSGSLFPDRS